MDMTTASQREHDNRAQATGVVHDAVASLQVRADIVDAVPVAD
jgi:hypothetical protein